MSDSALSMRVVSLVPSITESLRAWRHDPIACTEYCEQPDLPTVGGTKNPNLLAIAALAPDVVMVDREENRREDAEALEALGIEVFATDVRRLDAVASELDRVAARIGIPPQTGAWLDYRATPASNVERRRVFVPIWRRPWMTIGAPTYGSTLLDWLGFENVFGEDVVGEDVVGEDVVGRSNGGAYPEVTLEEVRRRCPDLVLVPSEPYAFRPHHLDELGVVAPVIEVDGQDLFWWGTRTPAAVERLRDALA